jgi:hypothetical protein
MIQKISLVVVLAVGGVASAQIQKQGSEVFPGKFQVGFSPLGVTVDFRGAGPGYKFTADFAGRLAERSNLGIYLGGGINYALTPGPTNTPLGHDVQLWVFVMLTLEKLVKIPLVPMVQMGVGTDIFLADSNYIGGTFAFRLGGGVHYYLTKNVGLGVETHFTFGPLAQNLNPTQYTWYGQWDFLLGGRFAF